MILSLNFSPQLFVYTKNLLYLCGMSRPKGTTKDNKRVMIATRVSKETKAIINKEKINVGRYLDDKINEDYGHKEKE